MEWYVLNYSWNDKKVNEFNIFNSSRFKDGVEKLLKNFITFEDFKEKLEKELMYAFWSKAEYEIMVADLFCEEPDEWEKIDIYTQVKPNLDILAHYIIDYYNNMPKRKKKLK